MSHRPQLDSEILSLLPENVEGKTILDLGMWYGTWEFLIRTRKNGYPYIIGTDLFKDYINLHRNLGIYNEVNQKDVLNTGFEDGSFDIVLACEMKVDYEKYWKDRIGKKHTFLMPRHYKIAKIIRETNSFGKVLDLGCGEGHILNMLPSSFLKYGCDISETIMKLVNDLNIKIKKCDLNEDFPFNIKFDFIICSEVLEHLDRFYNVLVNVKKHLRDDGLFLVTIPNVMHLRHRFAMLQGRLPNHDGSHVNFWHLEEFIDVLNDQGYKVLDFFPTYYSFPFFKRIFSKILSKIQGRTHLLYKLFGEQFLFICRVPHK